MTTTEEYEVQQEVARFRERPEQVICGEPTMPWSVQEAWDEYDAEDTTGPVWTLPEDMPDNRPTELIAAVGEVPDWPTDDPDAPAVEAPARGRHWDPEVQHRDAVPAWVADFTHAHAGLLGFAAGALTVAVLYGLGLHLLLVLGVVGFVGVVLIAAAFERTVNGRSETFLDGLLRRIDPTVQRGRGR